MVKLGKLNQVEDIFQWPVDRNEYPEYYKFIEKPVCLQDILDKLKDEEYQSLDEALNELGLVWENALAYNAEGSPIHKLAEKTKAKTDKMVQDKFGDVLRAQEEAAEAKALEAGIAGGMDLNDAHKDIREPQYWPKDRDEEGYPIGKVNSQKCGRAT